MSDVSFVYKAWQHMAILNAKVVIRTKHIGGDHRGVAPAILLKVGPAKHTTVTLTSLCHFVNEFVHADFFSPKDLKVPVMDIDHSLCIGVAKV